MPLKDRGPAYRCHACSSRKTIVIDSRPAGEFVIRRRRKCEACGTRLTTFEIPQHLYALLRGVDGGSIYTVRQRVEDVLKAVDDLIEQIRLPEEG